MSIMNGLSDLKHERQRQSALWEFLKKELPRIRKTLSARKKIDFFEVIEKQENKQNSFILDYRKIPLGCESFFVVLRKWNSYTPSLPGADRAISRVSQFSVGGGYFLFVQGAENTLDPGYGLVIDPGYNFIHNFGLAGFCLDDIDGILITHAHNDHTNDFESILSLLFQRNTKFLGKRKPRKIDLFLNVGSFKKFSNYLDLARKDEKNYIGKVTVMSPGQVYKIPKQVGLDSEIDLEICALYTNHHEIITADYALGICFKLGDRILLLTGDTGWKDETLLRNHSFLREHLGDVIDKPIDILVPHLGSIKRAEFDIDKGINYYDTHLGVLGIINSIERWKPELCVVSEFGEELAGLRGALVDELNKTCQELSKKTKCIPGDIGLFLFLDRKATICYLTNKLLDWKKIGYKDIETDDEHSIKYIDSKKLKTTALRTLKRINLGDGLKKFKAAYCDELFKQFRIRKKLDLQLGLLQDIVDFKADGDVDPSEVEENELAIKGRIMAFSCLSGNPEKLFDALANSWACFNVKSVFDSYHLYVPSDLLGFVEKVAILGYGVYLQPEDLTLQGNAKPFVDEFINKYKQVLGYYEKKQTKELEQAEEELGKIFIEVLKSNTKRDV
jgi:hypothetical protein